MPEKEYLWGILLHYFIQEKSAAKAHRILVEIYGDDILSKTTCRDRFKRFIDYKIICSRRTEFLRVFIPVLKSPNGHLGSSDVDLGRKTERSLCTLGSFIYTCAYYKL